MSILHLTVAGLGGGPLPVPQTRRLEAGRLTIGRGDECDWQLADTERDLSRVHCLIERVGDGYTVTDVSTNGVYLNGATEPLGRDISAPLADRDEITIGPYRIRVALEGTAAPEAGAEFGWFPTGGPETEPFPGFPETRAPLPGIPTGSDPFGNDTGPGGLSASSLTGFPDWPNLAQSPVPPGNSLLPPETADMSGWPLPGPVEPAPVEHVPVEHALGPSWLDGPEAGIGSNRTPDRDDLGVLDSYVPAPELPEPGLPEPVIPTATTLGWGAPVTDGISPAPPRAQSPTGPDRGRAAPNPAGVPPAAPATARAGDATPSQALGAFLEGLGLHDPTLPPGDELARLRALGVLFRELAGGLRDLLNARAMTKASFQVAPTMIAARNNNPFKFSVDLDQLLEALLAPRRQAYAEPLAAVAEAVADLKAHDFALIASTQQAVRAVLDDLSPASIIQLTNDTGVLGNLLPAARKAAWWDAYEAAHRRAIDGLEADLRDGFLRRFAQAYAEEAKKS